MNWRTCTLLVQLCLWCSVSGYYYDDKYEGDDCELEDNIQGKCVRLPQCPSAFEIIQNREHPATCGFIGFTPIVCCPVDQTLKSQPNEQNNDCYLGDKGLGTCKLPKDCPNAVQENQHPVLCSYNNYIQMVCCPPSTYLSSSTELIPTLQTTELIPDLPTKELTPDLPTELSFSVSAVKDTSTPLSLTDARNSRISEEECLNLQDMKLQQRQLNYKDEEGQKLDSLNNEIAEFPYQVALGISSEFEDDVYSRYGITWTCGGTIINNKFILTAAHCLQPDYYNKTVDYANIGNAFLRTYFNLTNPEQVVYKIIRQFPHPLYKPPSVYHDIGLVELEKAVEFTEYSRPACLHQNMDQETELISAGWGLGNLDLVEVSEKLQNVVLNVFSEDECGGIYKDLSGSGRLPNGIVHKYQFCADGVTDLGNKDISKSDSSVAIQFNNSTNNAGISYIVGIKSFGNTLGLEGVPGVYTRVAAYIPWIESIVWLQSDRQISVTEQTFNESEIATREITQKIDKPQTRLSISLSVRKCLFSREAENKEIQLIYKPEGSGGGILVFGGTDTLVGEFPHMVALGFSKSEKEYDITWQCGGSLISAKFVLTAAHCLASKDFGNLTWVHAGSKNLDTYPRLENPGQLVYKILRRIPHPLYKRPSTYHDIALLELDRPVDFSTDVKPACLYEHNTNPANDIVATGWGLTEEGITKIALQKVTLDLFTSDECDEVYDNLNNTRRLKTGIMKSNQFCAGGRSGIEDTCQGDSGGPLQFKMPNYEGPIWHLYGITSFSKTCGRQGIPGVYIRVSSYVPWIESIVWPDEYIPNPDIPELLDT